jgi:hypothetical protein
MSVSEKERESFDIASSSNKYSKEKKLRQNAAKNNSDSMMQPGTVVCCVELTGFSVELTGFSVEVTVFLWD